MSRRRLIDKLNDRFGTDFKQADQLFFDQVAETAADPEDRRPGQHPPEGIPLDRTP